MKARGSILTLVLVSLAATSVSACARSDGPSPSVEQTTRPQGWTAATHGGDAPPDYGVVFPADRVNRLSIAVTPENWEAMQANLTELLGPRGTGQPRIPGAVPGDVPPRDGGVPAQPVPPRDGGPLMPGAEVPRGGGGDMTPVNPMWVPATIESNGSVWTKVGVRYKGNSSLTSGWRNGSLRLPFKLDFDQFEDEYPEIENQRFHGFKQLSLSNAFGDATYMRDAITADVLAEAGLPAARTAHYEVVLDYGEGEKNLGLYVMIEVIDDTVVRRYFGDDSGNIYEADGPGASLALGAVSQIESSFQKENNAAEADWSDIKTLHGILHSPERTLDPATWRKKLEDVFDVDVFLEWLAITSISQNWDTYGAMSHNFYLYHDPATGKLTWISWDHNEVLGVRGGRPGPAGAVGSPSFGRDEVTRNWPLIRYLLDDSRYHESYVGYIQKTINGAFDPDVLEQKCQALADLIAPYAAGASGETVFRTAVQQLIDRIYERSAAAAAFVSAQR